VIQLLFAILSATSAPAAQVIPIAEKPVSCFSETTCVHAAIMQSEFGRQVQHRGAPQMIRLSDNEFLVKLLLRNGDEYLFKARMNFEKYRFRTQMKAITGSHLVQVAIVEN
jgi:hypothetical protein